MRVLRAEAMGMCFGVRDALTVLNDLDRPHEATILGELVHNEVVLDDLRRRGFAMVDEASRGNQPASTPAVVVTAHGIGDGERKQLEASGKRVVDTTCPLVLRVHRAARMLQDRGFHVLVIGQPGHVEVRGITADLEDFDVVPGAEFVRTYPHLRLGVVCQTTVSPRRVAEIRQAIEERNAHAEIRFQDTTCQPTRDRQRSLEALLSKVEGMVVVGGRNSNNTRELVALCREWGLPTWHVQDASDLDASWFTGLSVIGLTAGTSTLDATIAEVERVLVGLGREERTDQFVAAGSKANRRRNRS